MSRVFFYLLVKPLSLLPLGVLHVIADLAWLIGYKIFRYRAKVVTSNLRNSFPEKSDKEIRKLRSNYYRHFADLIVESFKNFSITQEQAIARFKVKNPEILKPFYDQGRSVLLVGGHYNNWEVLAMGIDHYIDHQSVAIYHRLGIKFLNDKILASREKFGLKMISRQEVKDFFANSQDLTCTIFGADQSPSISKKVYWTRFLNQDTPVMFGVEKFAKEKNAPVVFGRISKVKRGYYEFEMEVLFEQPLECRYGEITEAHTRKLEEQILEDPRYWLWTHKRWKRKPTPEDNIELQRQQMAAGELV